MKIKSIVILLTYLLLLSSLTVPAIACPPPYCGECEVLREGECEYNCSSGQCCDIGIGCVYSYDCSGECTSCSEGYCTSECEECEECVDDECIPCKCWDTGTVISGSITVQNAKLCEQVTHTSSISDTDHWLLGADSHGYPSDTVTYSWSASDGTPATSTTANFTWTAPTCTGPVTITLTADDVPDSMDNPCPDSTRDDDPNNFNDVSTVSLPSGCSNCSGTPLISLDANVTQDTDKDECDFTCICGAAGPPENIIVNVATPCYDNCSWKFGVAATADYSFGPCTDNERYDNYFNISSVDDPLLTEDNYCDIVDGFDYDPAIEGTGEGCPESGDFWYSNTECLWLHEAQHARDFLDNLEDEETALATDPALSDMAIDCTDSGTITCQAAKSAREDAIESAVNEAYFNASADCTEESAKETAWECFYNLAIEICHHALLQGWAPCDHCH